MVLLQKNHLRRSWWRRGDIPSVTSKSVSQQTLNTNQHAWFYYILFQQSQSCSSHLQVEITVHNICLLMCSTKAAAESLDSWDIGTASSSSRWNKVIPYPYDFIQKQIFLWVLAFVHAQIHLNVAEKHWKEKRKKDRKTAARVKILRKLHPSDTVV